jgi:hypothetical protein
MRRFSGTFAVVLASECFMTVGYHVERVSLAQRHRCNQLRPTVHGRALPPLESSLYSLDTYRIPFCLNNSSSIRSGSKFAAKHALVGSECCVHAKRDCGNHGDSTARRRQSLQLCETPAPQHDSHRLRWHPMPSFQHPRN